MRSSRCQVRCPMLISKIPVLGAVLVAMFSKPRCPVRCSEQNNLKLGAGLCATEVESRNDNTALFTRKNNEKKRG